MQDQFKAAMRMLAGAVTIITAGRGEAVAGLTATAVCSLSADPPRILVCLNRAGATYRAIVESDSFCVNVLAPDHEALAIDFAGRTGKQGAEKFTGSGWERAGEACPRLISALAAVRCRPHLVTTLSTHAIVIGDVLEAYADPSRPSLVYRDQQFLAVGPVASTG